MKIFKQKKIEISNFELQERYIPQKKSKNMYNSDSARKSVNFCKKKYFFFNFSDFRDMLEHPLKFSMFIFLKVSKKIQKWLYWVLSDIERNKVMNFGEPSPNLVETADCFRSSGHNLPPLRWNRVNKYF